MILSLSEISNLLIYFPVTYVTHVNHLCVKWYSFLSVSVRHLIFLGYSKKSSGRRAIFSCNHIYFCFGQVSLTWCWQPVFFLCLFCWNLCELFLKVQFTVVCSNKHCKYVNEFWAWILHKQFILYTLLIYIFILNHRNTQLIWLEKTSWVICFNLFAHSGLYFTASLSPGGVCVCEHINTCIRIYICIFLKFNVILCQAIAATIPQLSRWASFHYLIFLNAKIK